jgi:hypothetical protein
LGALFFHLEEQTQRAMESSFSFHEQLKEEVQYYEKIKQGEFVAITNFKGLGRLFIDLRISRDFFKRS